MGSSTLSVLLVRNEDALCSAIAMLEQLNNVQVGLVKFNSQQQRTAAVTPSGIKSTTELPHNMDDFNEAVQSPRISAPKSTETSSQVYDFQVLLNPGNSEDAPSGNQV